MRRPLILATILLPMSIAAARISKGPLFAGTQSYENLLRYSTSADAAAIFTTKTLLLALTLITIILLLRRYEIPAESILLLAITPAFLTSLVISNQAITLALLFLAALLVHDKEWFVFAITIPLLLADQAGILLGGIIALTLLAKRKLLGSAAVTGITVLAGVILGIPQMTPDLVGAPGTFVLLLAGTGAALHWSRKTYPYLLLGLALLLLGSLDPTLGLVQAIAAAALGGIALSDLRKRNWNLESLRTATTWLIICGLLFTGVSAANQVLEEEPGAEFSQLHAYLEALPRVDGNVFAFTPTREYLEWHGMHVVEEEPAVQQAHTLKELAVALPEYIVLAEKDEARNMRFIFENTDPYALIYEDGYYEVWKLD